MAVFLEHDVNQAISKSLKKLEYSKVEQHSVT